MNFFLFVAALLFYFVSLAFCFTRFESRHYPARYFVFFSLPAAIIIFVFAAIYFRPAMHAAAQEMSSRWLFLHLGLFLCGLAGLLTAVSSAMMYLVQSSQLKSRRPRGAFFKLPSLDLLDRVHFISLVWGTLLFSLGILSGFLWARDLNTLGKAFYDIKVVLSLVTGLMYWGILLLRFSSLGRGQKIAVGTVLVFLLLFITIVTSHNMSRFSAGV